jgi:hypothetical protein
VIGDILKTERSDVDHPLWRKKVDSSLFRQNGTTIPQWAAKMWGIVEDFSTCRSKYKDDSKVKVIFENKTYDGWVTIAPEGRKTPAYRLFYVPDLSYMLKNEFLMSFARDIEGRLRKSNDPEFSGIEDEIPFWEFLDIEYERKNRTFYLTAYYKVKPTFSELFKHLVESPILHKIDDELSDKPPFRIYKTDWKSRAKLEFELGATNVLYTLIDTESKLLYIGEASNLIDRLRQEHTSIPKWNYFRYNILPNEIAHHRKTIERMAIKDLATIFLEAPDSQGISKYKLTNDRIDV